MPRRPSQSRRPKQPRRPSQPRPKRVSRRTSDRFDEEHLATVLAAVVWAVPLSLGLWLLHAPAAVWGVVLGLSALLFVSAHTSSR